MPERYREDGDASGRAAVSAKASELNRSKTDVESKGSGRGSKPKQGQCRGEKDTDTLQTVQPRIERVEVLSTQCIISILVTSKATNGTKGTLPVGIGLPKQSSVACM